MSSPLLLLLDTSTERGLIALAKGKQIVIQKELPFGLQNAQNLLPCIEKCTQECGFAPQDLQGVAVGVGPGSYTGIRVGVAVAQGLALACHIPWISLCTLECFLPSQNGTFAVVIDAKIGGMYVWKAKRHGQIVTSLSEAQLLPLPEVQSFLDDVEIIVTPHLNLIQPKINIQKTWEEQPPQAHRMAELAQLKFSHHDVVHDDRVELLYLRKTQAELNKR